MGLTINLLRRGMRLGWRRGVVEGSRPWTVVGGVALLGYLIGRAMHREPEVVFSERLDAGEALRITHRSLED
jgi:hypothetical protein